MKFKKSGLIFLEILIFISLVYAATETYQVNTPIDLKLTCTINNEVPSASTVMLFSLSYPNGTTALSNVTATSQGNGIFNYTYNFPIEGKYHPILVCIDGDKSNSDPNGEYIITPRGDSLDTSQSLIYVILLIINLIFLTIFIILSIKIPYENPRQTDERGRESITRITKAKYLKLLCIWITYGLYLWFVTIITGMANNYISFIPLRDMTNNLYLFSSGLGYGISILMICLFIYNTWKDIILNKIILRDGKALLNEL